ncbi:hypothetical protein CDD81_614 [Ophiocordyceps australis]|uniref:C2H2-type domain-containing protein n=1 Tax=Ophiocordyceps australis TaxID=1399860 RepID=A0A2C5XBG3_9HYPO|nr:hypothetical protein CDD81_614 [Ophiocordyceps australis]
MATCGTCCRLFPAGSHSRQQHLDATGHSIPSNECDTCFRFFSSRRAVNQHMTDTDHWGVSTSPEPEYQCTDCSDDFYTESELRDHEVVEHLYCSPCDRYFQHRNNINQHLNGRLHRKTNVQCPFCRQTFGTATGLVHHLERGSCPQAPVDRDQLYLAVRRRDPDSLLCKKLLGWTGSTDYEASNLAWNSSVQAYECYFCHQYFKKLSSLNQHLKSPTHQDNLYHCPNLACRREFTTLAAVINHLESESCSYMRFATVQANVERILDPGRMIQGL